MQALSTASTIQKTAMDSRKKPSPFSRDPAPEESDHGVIDAVDALDVTVTVPASASEQHSLTSKLPDSSAMLGQMKGGASSSEPKTCSESRFPGLRDVVSDVIEFESSAPLLRDDPISSKRGSLEHVAETEGFAPLAEVERPVGRASPPNAVLPRSSAYASPPVTVGHVPLHVDIGVSLAKADVHLAQAHHRRTPISAMRRNLTVEQVRTADPPGEGALVDLNGSGIVRGEVSRYSVLDRADAIQFDQASKHQGSHGTASHFPSDDPITIPHGDSKKKWKKKGKRFFKGRDSQEKRDKQDKQDNPGAEFTHHNHEGTLDKVLRIAENALYEEASTAAASAQPPRKPPGGKNDRHRQPLKATLDDMNFKKAHTHGSNTAITSSARRETLGRRRRKSSRRRRSEGLEEKLGSVFEICAVGSSYVEGEPPIDCPNETASVLEPSIGLSSSSAASKQPIRCSVGPMVPNKRRKMVKSAPAVVIPVVSSGDMSVFSSRARMVDAHPTGVLASSAVRSLEPGLPKGGIVHAPKSSIGSAGDLSEMLKRVAPAGPVKRTSARRKSRGVAKVSRASGAVASERVTGVSAPGTVPLGSEEREKPRPRIDLRGKHYSLRISLESADIVDLTGDDGQPPPVPTRSSRPAKSKRRTRSSNSLVQHAVGPVPADYIAPPMLKPLSQEEKAIVEALLTGKCETEEVATIECAGIILTREDFKRLRSVRWLNDEVINAYVALINDRYSKRGLRGTGELSQSSQRPKTFVFNTYFHTRLSSTGYDFPGVARWTRRAKVSVCDLDYVLVPVNLGDAHWILAGIDVARRTFLYLDSMHGRDRHSVVDTLRKWLFDEVQDKRGTAHAEKLRIDSWSTLVNRYWERNSANGRASKKRKSLKIPLQKDTGSCGVFTTKFADCLAMGENITFAHDDIRLIRQRMALELYRRCLPG